MFNSFSVYLKVLSDFSIAFYFEEELGRQFIEIHHFNELIMRGVQDLKNKQ